MKKLLLASVATSALMIAGAAGAADLRMPLKAPPPPPPVFSWSGCYVGAHWGWGWGKAHGDPFTTFSGFATTHGRFDNNISGPIFGGQLGCNYQWPGTSFVIGIEGSIAGADINGERSGTAVFGFFSSTFIAARAHTKIDELASVTGRIGWAGWDPQVLLYIKGGWAWMHQRTDLNIVSSFDGFSAPFAASFNNSRGGWTVGAGFEWAFTFAPRWSAFAEWDHYDFGHRDVTFTDLAFENFTGVSNIDLRLHTRIDTVKIGVNYKLFGGF